MLSRQSKPTESRNWVVLKVGEKCSANCYPSCSWNVTGLSEGVFIRYRKQQRGENRGGMRLVDRINDYIVHPHLTDTRNRTAHYPSEASIISRTDGKVIGKCHRASWYSWTGVPYTNPMDARGKWTVDFGKELERMYVEWIKQLGIWAANNVKFYDPMRNVSGEADVFIFSDRKIERRIDDKNEFKISCPPIIGVEIKSAYGYGFQKKIKTFPKIENLLQVALYLDNFKNIEEWRLIYHSRDTMENVEYKITWGDKDKTFLMVDDTTPVKLFFMQDIYDRYTILGQYVIKKEMPPRDYTYAYTLEQSLLRQKAGEISVSALRDIKAGKKTDSDWQCLYCGHLDECWKDRRKEILSG